MRHSYSKTQLDKALVTQRKSMREQQKQTAFMTKTRNIYRGMVVRAKDERGIKSLPFSLEEFRTKAGFAVGSNCVYCGVKLTVNNLAADHEIPIAQEGSFDLENVNLPCKSCNYQKGQMRGEAFYKLRSVAQQILNQQECTDLFRRLTIGGKFARF